MVAMLFVFSMAKADLLIDSHVHIFSPDNPDSFGPGIDFDNVIRPMLEKKEIQKVFLLSAGYHFSNLASAAKENNFVSGIAQKNKASVYGFCGVNISEDWAEAELFRCIHQLNLFGLKIHPAGNKVDLKSTEIVARLDALFKLTDQHHIPVVIDSAEWDVKEARSFLDLTERHLDTNFILAHAFSIDFRRILQIAERRQAGQGYANIYADISEVSVNFKDGPEHETLLWYLRKFGFSNLLFGSDYPAYSIDEAERALKSYSLTPSELAEVKGGTALRLIKARTEK